MYYELCHEEEDRIETKCTILKLLCQDVNHVQQLLYMTSTTTLLTTPQATMAPNDNFIQRAVNNGVATAGTYAGDAVNAAGKTVSAAGRNAGDR